MTGQSQIRDDWIDAIFRPAVAFFIGMTLGYVGKLAAISSLWFAAAVLFLGALFFMLILLVDTVFSRAIDTIARWFGAGIGIKPSKTKHEPHWFVRYGWMFGLILGMLAVFYLPQEAMAWIF